MIERVKALNKYEIPAICLLVVSVSFNMLFLTVGDFSMLPFLQLIGAVLFGASILFKNNRVISKFFSVVLAVEIVSLYLFISQDTTNFLISTAYLIAFLFLFIDSLKRHKFLKISRIIMLVITALEVLLIIMRAVDAIFIFYYDPYYDLCSIGIHAVFLIYYFRIADKITLENELHRLKAEYERGNITPEEYANAKQKILNSL